MPRPPQKDWTARKKQQHDQHFAEVRRLIHRFATHSKGLREDTLKTLAYAAAIADAFGVPKEETAENPSGEANLFDRLDRVSKAIAQASRNDLSPAQVRVHHRNLDRCIPVFKRSAQRASELSRDLLEVHRLLRAMSELYTE